MRPRRVPRILVGNTGGSAGSREPHDGRPPSKTSVLIRVVDVFSVRFGAETAYGLNVAQGGFAGEIGRAMASSEKSAPGSLSYVAGAVASLELQVVPKAIRVLVGPDYRPEPEPRS